MRSPVPLCPLAARGGSGGGPVRRSRPICVTLRWPAPVTAHQPQQQVFGADVMMTHRAGFFDGKFQHLLRTGGKFDVVAGILPEADSAFDHLAHRLGLQAQVAQNTPGHTAFFFH